jgi:hypothetical protein
MGRTRTTWRNDMRDRIERALDCGLLEYSRRLTARNRKATPRYEEGRPADAKPTLRTVALLTRAASAGRSLRLAAPSGSCPTESSAVSTCPPVPSWHVQDEGVIDCTQILWIGGDDMQVPLPRAEGN